MLVGVVDVVRERALVGAVLLRDARLAGDERELRDPRVPDVLGEPGPRREAAVVVIDVDVDEVDRRLRAPERG